MNIDPRIEANSIPEPNTGCWLWLGRPNRGGYGRVHVGGRQPGSRMVLAHRLAYEGYVGPIPDDLRVLHRCDTPACVNPMHMFLGTQLENVADRNSKNRTANGRAKRQSALGEDDIRAMREARRAGESVASIARRFGISGCQASLISRGLSWRHVQ